MGNRLSKSDVGGGIGGTENYTVNAANMLLTRGSNAYTNDANGNTLTGGGRTNTWDSENRMTKCVLGANMSTFIYGADGIRHSSVVNGTSTDFVLDNSMFVRELQGGNSKATYFMGASGPAYRRDDVTSAVRWYLYDGLGSVLGEVDPGGNITATRKYDVYGAVRSSTGTSTSKHKFVGSFGHPSEDETNLTYMRARYYDPQSGRFVSQDKSRNGDNWFAYCSNDPINYADESGNIRVPSKPTIIDKYLGGMTGAFLMGFFFYLAATMVTGGAFPAALLAGLMAAISFGVTTYLWENGLVRSICRFYNYLKNIDDDTNINGMMTIFFMAYAAEAGAIFAELLCQEQESMT